MEPILCEAAEGYYFPETYTVAETSGISVTRNANGHQIMVSGTPTANVTITLPDAVADPDYKQDDNKPVNPQAGTYHLRRRTVTGALSPPPRPLTQVCRLWRDRAAVPIRHGMAGQKARGLKSVHFTCSTHGESGYHNVKAIPYRDGLDHI